MSDKSNITVPIQEIKDLLSDLKAGNFSLCEDCISVRTELVHWCETTISNAEYEHEEKYRSTKAGLTA